LDARHSPSLCDEASLAPVLVEAVCADAAHVSAVISIAATTYFDIFFYPWI
jgi:hypothetical protein